LVFLALSEVLIVTILQSAFRLIVRPNRVARIRQRVRAWRFERMHALNTRELRDHASKLRSSPSILYLDTASICNLRCPFCPTGTGSSDIVRGILQPSTFQAIVKRIDLGALSQVHLYNWGEPLLNPHLTEYIRFFSMRGKETVVNANFSAKAYNDAYLTDLVQSGLTSMVVSVDGATQDVYERYRVGGSLDRVLGNMRRLHEVKQRMSATLPFVQFKLLLNKFNETQLDHARRLAEECGAELVVHKHFWVPEELRDEWESETVRRELGDQPVLSQLNVSDGEIHSECRQMWEALLVNVNGDVFPCCIVQQDNHKVGNLVEQSFQSIWNGEKMRQLRTYVVDADAPKPNFPNHCIKCTNRYCTLPGVKTKGAL